MKDGFEILDTADGFARITTFSVKKARRVSLLLMFRYGFIRWGIYIPPITDDGIYPSYYRWRMKILHGWDNWFGYDWFATNQKKSDFLIKFYSKHCKKEENT